MDKRLFAPVITAVLSLAALLVLLLAGVSAGAPVPVQAAPAMAVPTVTGVDPTSAPNDLAMPIVITGTDFTTGSLVLLGGDAPLDDVGWVSGTRMTATVPWGLAPGVYTVTVFNPGEGSGSLPNAFTVTQGLGVWTTGGPYGGYTIGITKKPGTPTTVYALAADVGLFASENAGGSWKLIYESGYPTGPVFDAQDAEVMYQGADGEFFARTTDGGDTWEVLSQIPATGDCYLVFPAAHPSSAGVVYVGIGSCGGIPFSPGDGGIFRSDDYGDTWITVTNGMTDTDVQSIAIHPNDPAKMLAGTLDGNLYVSTDGGENWSLNAHLDGSLWAVYFNPYQPLEAWATAGTPTHDVPYLYTSTNLTDWTPVVIPGAPGAWPNRWDLTFLTDTIWASSSAAYTSTDGGASWTEVPGLYHGANAVAVTPDNPQEVYVGTQEGVDKSQDGGQTWRQVNEGLAAHVPRVLATSPSDLETVLVQTNVGLYRTFNGGDAWQGLSVGAGAYPTGDYMAFDAYSSTQAYSGGGGENIFGMDISQDAGATWERITTTLPLEYAGWYGDVFAVAPHPNTPGRVLAGLTIAPPGSSWWLPDAIGLIYASDDYGRSWIHIGPTQPISFVIDIAYDAVDPNLVYMATQGSGLWKSTDGGTTWQAMPAPGGRSIIDEIAPHPSISGTLVIATSDDTHGAGLYLSQDAGETWTFLNSDVDDPVVYAPSIPPILYGRGAVPQNRGLVRSFDNGQTWEQVADAPYPTCLATATDGERVILYIGTPGGVVQIDLNDALLGAGVYRWTSLLPTPRLYLPLAFRDHAP